MVNSSKYAEILQCKIVPLMQTLFLGVFLNTQNLKSLALDIQLYRKDLKQYRFITMKVEECNKI